MATKKKATKKKATKKKATKKAAKKPAPPFEFIEQPRKDGSTTHWYRVAGESRSGRGVTALLSNGYPKGALKVWAARCVADAALDDRDTWEPLAERSRDAAYDYLWKAPDRDRDEAANRGQEVHALAERLAAGEEVEVPEPLEGMVDTYLDWRATWQPANEYLEIVGHNATHNYLGKFDGLATFTGWFAEEPEREAQVLYDIKTNRSGVFPDVALQLAAYANFEEVCLELTERTSGSRTYWECWEPEPMPAVDGIAVLHLSPDGWQFRPIDPGLARKCFALFLMAAKIAEFIGSGWKAEDAGWSAQVLQPSVPSPYESF